MRNLKRTLSLVMAMALIVGMMVVSASAVSSDFNDSAEITNTEAVDVMTAIGVFEGTDKGAFNPTGILTREQAAKIVAVMLLGEEDSLDLPRKITNVIQCRNPRCITSIEQELPHVFYLADEKKEIYRCLYCEEKYEKK